MSNRMSKLWRKRLNSWRIRFRTLLKPIPISCSRMKSKILSSNWKSNIWRNMKNIDQIFRNLFKSLKISSTKTKKSYNRIMRSWSNKSRLWSLKSKRLWRFMKRIRLMPSRLMLWRRKIKSSKMIKISWIRPSKVSTRKSETTKNKSATYNLKVKKCNKFTN